MMAKLKETINYHDTVLLLTSVSYFTLPIRFLSQLYLFRKTNQTYLDITTSQICDILLAVAIAYWIKQRVSLSERDSMNMFTNYD